VRKEYRIKIDNELIGLERVGTEPAQSQDPSKAAERLERETSSSGIGKTIAITMGRQALNYAISNYGNLTGDYVTQERIQAGIEIFSTITMMITGGVPGIIIGAGSIALKAVSQQIDITKRNREVDLLRMRTGTMNFSGGRL